MGVSGFEGWYESPRQMPAQRGKGVRREACTSFKTVFSNFDNHVQPRGTHPATRGHSTVAPSSPLFSNNTCPLYYSV